MTFLEKIILQKIDYIGVNNFISYIEIKEKGLSSQRQEKIAPLQTKNANSLSIVEDNPYNNSIRINIKKVNKNEQKNQNILKWRKTHTKQ